MSKSSYRAKAFLTVLITLGIFIFLNVLSSFVHKRVDLTKEGRFTLTEATKDLLRETDDLVTVQVFLDGEMPAGIKRLRNATEDMLDEFRAYTGNKLQYRFSNPLEDAEGSEAKRNILAELAEKGIAPQRFRIQDGEGFEEKVFLPGALVIYKGREYPVNLLEALSGDGSQNAINNSVALLEYKIANAMQKLRRDRKPRIGFLKGHGELDTMQLADAASSLAPYYVLSEIDLEDFTVSPDEYDLIVVAKPTKPFSDKDLFKLDQFVTHGGKLFWLFENLAADIDSLQNRPYYIPSLYNLGLDELMFKYGVRVNENLVQDLQANPIPLVVGVDALGNANQQSLFPWLYHPVFTNANKDHPITKNLGPVAGEFSATIDTIKQAEIDKTILLTSSQYSKLFYSPIKIDVEQARQKPNPEQFRKSFQPVAVALEGNFGSIFTTRMNLQMKTIIDGFKDWDFKEKSERNKMLVASDGDFIRNDYDSRNRRPLPLGFNRFNKKTFSNKDFVLNGVEWLLDNSGIIVARNKDVTLRLLDVEKIKKEKSFWQIINVALPLVFVMLFGLIYSFIRKRRFTT